MHFVVCWQSRALSLQQKEKASSSLVVSGSAMLASVSCIYKQTSCHCGQTNRQHGRLPSGPHGWIRNVCVHRADFGRKHTAGACSLHVPMRSDRQITRLRQTGAGRNAIESRQTCTKPQILTLNLLQWYQSQQLMVSLTRCFPETTVSFFLEALRNKVRKWQIRVTLG